MTYPDPFPKDTAAKRIYVVRPLRTLHLNDQAHYEAGTKLLLSSETVGSMRLAHLVMPTTEIEAEPGLQEASAGTRAIRSPHRTLTARKK